MDITMQQEQALGIARMLVKAGVPMFLARPNPQARNGFDLPFGWESNEPDVSVVDAWRPGWALCAVTGRTFDLVDIDPRSGGDERDVPMPHTYLAAETPSGGRHHFIKTLGVPSLDGKVAPGVDVKSGTLEGDGRGFAFIAPTIRVSKVDGVAREYRWVVGPEGPVLPTPDQLAADGTGTLLRARVLEIRRTTASAEPRRVPESVARREWDTALRRLRDDVAHWSRNGWGGEAHSSILAHTTHLARLNPDGAEEGFFWAFRDAGCTPDAGDLSKLQSALEKVVPDVVVPDSEMQPGEHFFLGGDAPPALGSSLPGAPAAVGLSTPFGALGNPGVTVGGAEDPFRPVTRARFRDRTPPAPTSFGHFGGTRPLFYADGVHWVQGESESGKTWVALGVLVEVLRSGGTALLVDYEDTEARVFERLEQLGLADDEVERLVYVEAGNVTFGQLVTHVAAAEYSLMVIDGVTSALSAAGLSGRDEQELTRWADLLPRRARMAVCIDHVTKDVEGRNGMAIGTQAKKSVVTGSSFEVRAKEKFGRGSAGLIELRLQKDKPGFLRGQNVSFVVLHFNSDIATGAVSLLTAQAAKQASGKNDPASAFFSSNRGAEVWGIVLSFESYHNALPHHSAKHLKGLARGDMGIKAKNEDLEDAIRAFKVRAGVAGVRAPEWLMEFGRTATEGADDERDGGQQGSGGPRGAGGADALQSAHAGPEADGGALWAR